MRPGRGGDGAEIENKVVEEMVLAAEDGEDDGDV